MGTAATSSGVNRSSGNLKAKVSYLFLLVPIVGISALVWRAKHILTKPEVSIFVSAERGNFHDVQAHILTGTPVNDLSAEGHTPLYYAVLSGKEDVVELLLQNKARPDAEGKGQTSPLYAAAGGGNLQLVKDLVAAGADPKRGLRSGATPLFAATDSGNPEMVKYFLDAGADPNINLKNAGGTPLCNACIKGNLESVRELLDRGAKPEIGGFEGITPLEFAAEGGHMDIVQLLVERGANVDQPDGNLVIPLSSALERHVDEKIAWFLFDHMKDFHAVDNHNADPLHYASEGGASVKMVKALLAKGVDPNLINNEGDTPYSIAMAKRNDAIADALREGGARMTLRQMIDESLQRGKPKFGHGVGAIP
jgi:ankyrin repeat protein